MRTCRWWCSGRGRHCASPIGHCAIGHWANREGRGARRRTRNELRDGEAERSRERAVEKTLTEMRAGALPDAAKCRARPFECKPSERGVASRRWPGRRHGNPRSLNGFGCRAGSRGTDETEDADETCLAKREMENPRRVSAINEMDIGRTLCSFPGLLRSQHCDRTEQGKLGCEVNTIHRSRASGKTGTLYNGYVREQLQVCIMIMPHPKRIPVPSLSLLAISSSPSSWRRPCHPSAL